MARTALQVQPITSAGTDLTLTSANVDGHSVRNNGRTFILVVNGDASPMTVTLQTPGSVQGLAIADQTITVPASESRYIFFKKVHEQPNRDVYVDFSSVTSLTCGAGSV